ncbi:hypothetical protein [Rubritalea profundi]|nr:hypothetical protein [Rubritalea profundi]
MALITAAQQGKATFSKIAMEMHELDESCTISPQALWNHQPYQRKT